MHKLSSHGANDLLHKPLQKVHTREWVQAEVFLTSLAEYVHIKRRMERAAGVSLPRS
jgi:hypothetical protein